MSSLTLPISSLQRLNPQTLTELLQTEAQHSPQKSVRITCEPVKAGEPKLGSTRGS